MDFLDKNFIELKNDIESMITIKVYIIIVLIITLIFYFIFNKNKIIFNFRYYRQRLKLKFGYRSFNKQWKREIKEAEKEKNDGKIL